MKIEKIYSDRHFNTWPSWQIVYEWEDEISEKLKVPLAKSPYNARRSFKGFLQRYARKLLNRDLTSNSAKGKDAEKFLYFEMRPRDYHSFSNTNPSIPIIIDFWKRDQVEEFKNYYKDCSHLLITSLEVLTFLKKNNFPGKLVHFPMSLPDKYKITSSQKFDKKFDVILAGRTNPVLLKYFEKYKEKNPHVEFVYREEKNGEFSYFSNKRGLLGDFESRQAYNHLLSMAKVALYSTPGMDDNKGRTGGFNPVTPRLFEILAAGCEVIMRYPENEETKFFELATLAAPALSYEQFEQQMHDALHSPAPIKRNALYLQQHYTSKRLEIIKTMS